jgi:hypothetical protein
MTVRSTKCREIFSRDIADAVTRCEWHTAYVQIIGSVPYRGGDDCDAEVAEVVRA